MKCKSWRGLRFGALGLVVASALALLAHSVSTRAHVGDLSRPSTSVGRPSTSSGGPSATDLRLGVGSAPAPRPVEGMRRAVPEASPPMAVARYEGVPAPGLPITLRSEGSTGAEQVRWVQTQGPPTPISDPTSPSPSVRVPEGASLLGFTLFVANTYGTDSSALVICVPGRDGAAGEPRLRADAGDDQVGIVGRQITLNGARSEPRGQVGYRWLQVAGPRVRLEFDDGYIYSFVPQAPGIYQFALVVAQGGEMSRPDLVTVSVGNPASPYGIDPTPEAPEALHDVARAALGAVPGGIDVGPPLAEAFDGVADRMDFFHCYGEAYSELSRRLESLLPTDPVRRGVWDDRLFIPLTARLIEGMRSQGLDLRRPEAQTAPLTSAQRAVLADLFRAMSKGFRANIPGPGSSPIKNP